MSPSVFGNGTWSHQPHCYTRAWCVLLVSMHGNVDEHVGSVFRNGYVRLFAWPACAPDGKCMRISVRVQYESVFRWIIRTNGVHGCGRVREWFQRSNWMIWMNHQYYRILWFIFGFCFCLEEHLDFHNTWSWMNDEKQPRTLHRRKNNMRTLAAITNS